MNVPDKFIGNSEGTRILPPRSIAKNSTRQLKDLLLSEAADGYVFRVTATTHAAFWSWFVDPIGGLVLIMRAKVKSLTATRKKLHIEGSFAPSVIFASENMNVAVSKDDASR